MIFSIVTCISKNFVAEGFLAYQVSRNELVIIPLFISSRCLLVCALHKDIYSHCFNIKAPINVISNLNVIATLIGIASFSTPSFSKYRMQRANFPDVNWRLQIILMSNFQKIAINSSTAGKIKQTLNLSKFAQVKNDNCLSILMITYAVGNY